MSPAAPTLVLLHSPLAGPASWGGLPEALRAAGREVITVDVCEDDEPPYAPRYVASVARQVNAAGPTGVVLVAHSGAGALVPALAIAQRAAHRPVRGYLFVDAVLPRWMPGNRLDLLRAEDAETAAELREHLEAGGRFPTWTDAELAETITDSEWRQAVLKDLHPRGLDFFTEALPLPVDWPDAPCGFVRTSAAYDVHARAAAARGWAVRLREGGHFAGCDDPGGLAAAVLDVAGPW
ncbi:MAG TPA: hypothetical protein VLC50_01720 [Actinomycetes bacterium]|nr:hypothetical protein [Actinomycetes bacterium]